MQLAPTGEVLAASQDTRAALGNVSVSVRAAGSGSAVRQDGRGRKYLDRNFCLTASGGTLFTGQTVNVRFYGLTSEFTRLQAADAGVSYAALKSTQYSGANEDCDRTNNVPAGELRTVAAPTSTPGGGVPGFVAQAAVADHFSGFYLSGSAVPLPVELVAFTADAHGPAVQLAWRTASEKNSAHFEIERSEDGQQFSKIGELAGQGTTSSPIDYTYRDEKLSGSSIPYLAYCRLRQVDLDGTSAYSPVRAVRLAPASLADANFTLAPNPAHAAVAVAGLAPGTPVAVFDGLGRQVSSSAADAVGTARLALPAGLATGMYVVRAAGHSRRLSVE